jgi:cytochrome c-type biogenesis protein CcmH
VRFLPISFCFSALCFSTLWSFALLASEDAYKFDNEAQRATFIELTKELRCPKCQNQNLADSDAMIAQDLKRKVHELILEGQSSEQIISFMKQRYGDFVYYQPPVNPTTIWLWVLPIGFIFAAGGTIFFSRRKGSTQLSDEQVKHVQTLLEKDD